MLNALIDEAIRMVGESEQLGRLARTVAPGYIDPIKLDAIDADTAELRKLLETAAVVNKRIAEQVQALA